MSILTGFRKVGTGKNITHGITQPIAVLKRFAPNFNGVSQYAVLPNIPISNDSFTVEGKFIVNGEGGAQTVFWGGIKDVQLRFQGTSSLRFSWYDGTSAPSVTLTDANFEVGKVNTFKAEFLGNSGMRLTFNSIVGTNSTPVSPISISTEQQLGRRNSGEFFNGLIYDVLINGGSVYSYPMRDGWANNPTMKNTGSGADGTFINMTEASWVEIDA